MEVFFKRDVLQSYMVIKNDCYAGYDMEMLKRNRISCFLPFQIIAADGGLQYWYEINGLQMLDAYLEQCQVDYGLLEKMIAQIEMCFQMTEQYLLVEDYVCLCPDKIAIRPETGEIFFCYLQGQERNSMEQFRNFIEEIMPKVNHRDKQAVEAVYAVYEIVLQENYDFAEVKKVFTQKDAGSLVKEQREKESEWQKEEWSANEGTVEKITSCIKMESGKEVKNFTMLFQKLKEPFTPEKWRKTAKNRKDSGASMHISFEPEEEEPISDNPTVLLSDVTGIIGKLNYNGRNEEDDFLIQTDEFLIGTKEGSVNGQLKSAAVSRIHARIRQEDGGYFIEDLNSKNGTWLDGELLNYKERRPLQKNARIRFADEEYIFS